MAGRGVILAVCQEVEAQVRDVDRPLLRKGVHHPTFEISNRSVGAAQEFSKLWTHPFRHRKLPEQVAGCHHRKSTGGLVLQLATQTAIRKRILTKNAIRRPRW